MQETREDYVVRVASAPFWHGRPCGCLRLATTTSWRPARRGPNHLNNFCKSTIVLSLLTITSLLSSLVYEFSPNKIACKSHWLPCLHCQQYHVNNPPTTKKLCKSPHIPCIPHHQYVSSPAIQFFANLLIFSTSFATNMHSPVISPMTWMLENVLRINALTATSMWILSHNRNDVLQICQISCFHHRQYVNSPMTWIFLISPQIASFHHHQYDVNCALTWWFANLLHNSLFFQPLVCEFLAQQMCFWMISFDSLLQQPYHLCVHFVAKWWLFACNLMCSNCNCEFCRMHPIWIAGKPPVEYQLLTSSLPPLAQRCCPLRLCPPHRVWCGVRFSKIALART